MKEKDHKKEEPKILELPKTFDKCPNCGSTRRFSIEATKDRVDKGKGVPILTAVEYKYEGIAGAVRIRAFLDVCVECGMMYAVELVKERGFGITIPPGHLPGQN